jgi:hypothetical protein
LCSILNCLSKRHSSNPKATRAVRSGKRFHQNVLFCLHWCDRMIDGQSRVEIRMKKELTMQIYPFWKKELRTCSRTWRWKSRDRRNYGVCQRWVEHSDFFIALWRWEERSHGKWIAKSDLRLNDNCRFNRWIAAIRRHFDCNYSDDEQRAIHVAGTARFCTSIEAEAEAEADHVDRE